MEIEGIHPALAPMLAKGQLSGKKIIDLLRLREFVDRMASSHYVPAKELAVLKERFGVEPDIQSWADYFQTEIASQYFGSSDEEFRRIVDTVRFDLIAAAKIFTGKPESFLLQVREDGIRAYGKKHSQWSEADEEAAHLYILEQYFSEMGLGSKELAKEDEDWFASFVDGESQARAI